MPRRHWRRGIACFSATLTASMLLTTGGANAATEISPTTQATASNAGWLAYAPPPAIAGAVCLVDTGVNLNSDTRSAVTARTALDGGVADDVDGEVHHGTRMAMIMAAARNGSGMVGAWPALRVVSVRAVAPPPPGQEPAFYYTAYDRAIRTCTDISTPAAPIMAVELAVGSREAPSQTEADTMAEYVALAHADNVSVVAAAGNVDHDQILALAESLKPGSGSGEETLVPQDPSSTGRLEFAVKDTEQYHVCIGAPGINRADERRFTLAVLDSILGGSSSSRLFIEVREKRGLAYSVGTYTEQFTDTGVVATYVGTREDNVEQACEVIGTELKKIQCEPVTADELARAKEHVKGRLVLSGESTAARMSRIARATLHDIPLLNLDEMLARVDAVSVEDVSELASELYAEERLSVAGVGRNEDRFRSAVAPVSGALAA